MLHEDGRYTDRLELLLDIYAEVHERWELARASLRELGPVVDSAAGSAKPNPAAAIAAKAADQLPRLLRELGLTPSAQHATAAAEPEDELDAFLAEGVGTDAPRYSDFEPRRRPRVLAPGSVG
jgi:P27 family predicted phage terminase small subunit